MDIWTINNKHQEKFLRQKTSPFDFSAMSRKEIRELIKIMRAAMKKAHGIGLSANQIGLDKSVFVARVENKFYTIFNPVITKKSSETTVLEEGCLSVPEIFGPVERPERIIIEGTDAGGKKLKIKAWGLLARVFQHEVDHLNGMLFIDRTKNIYKLPISERLQNRQKDLNKDKNNVSKTQ